MITAEYLKRLAAIHKKYMSDMNDAGFKAPNFVIMSGLTECELPVTYSESLGIINVRLTVDGVEFFDSIYDSKSLRYEVERLNAEEQKKLEPVAV
jgi:hypothetical protein